MKTILVDAIRTFVLEEGGINEEMFQLLESYSNPKVVLTSANDQQIEKFDLNNIPYEYFTLKHDPEKQDPKYYQTFLESKGLNVEDVIYFEHDLGAVESARSVGINSYHYDYELKDIEALKQFIDENI